MSAAPDLFSRQTAPQAAPAETLAGYLVDLHVNKLTDAQLTAKRQSGAYRNLRAQDLAGYHKLARGR